MPNLKISQFTNLTNAQGPTDIIPIVVGAAAPNYYITLNDLFADLSFNSADGSTSWSTDLSPAVSAAGSAKVYYNSGATRLSLSNDGGAFSPIATDASVPNVAANRALSNLASVAINTALLPASAGSTTVGSAAKPFSSYYLGTSANSINLIGTGTAARTITFPDASGTVQLTTTSNVNIPTSTYAGLPATPGYVAMYKLTDQNKGLWTYDTTYSGWRSQNCQVWYATDWGIVADGITDNATNLQALINAAVAFNTGIHIIFPNGDILHSKQIVYPGTPSVGVRITGALGQGRGPSGTIFRYTGTSNAPGFVFIGINGSLIENVIFDGNSASKYPLALIAANTFSATTSGAITANAAAQNVTLTNVTNITVGSLLPVDTAGNQEVVEVTALPGGNQITAIFSKNHASGVGVGYSAGSSGVKLANCIITGASGTDSANCLIGNFTASGTMQVSEVLFYNCYASGQGIPGTVYYGFRVIGGGNVKNIKWVDGSSVGHQYGYDLSGAGGACSVSYTTLANQTVYEFIVGNNTCILEGCETESTVQSYIFGTTGSNPGALSVIGCSFEGTLDSNDVAVAFSGKLTLDNNYFANRRIPGTTVPKIVGGNLITSDVTPGSILSRNNFYENASALSQIFFDGGGNALATTASGGTYAYNKDPQLISEYDLLGVAGALVKSRPIYGCGAYYRASAIIATGSAPSYTGIIRLNNTDAINFRDAADSADVNLISSNSSNQAILGGASGCIFNNLTSGRIALVGASGLLTDDSGILYDGASNSIGLGADLYRLTVSGAARNTVYIGISASGAVANDILNYAATGAVTGEVSGFNYSANATTGFTNIFTNTNSSNGNAKCGFEIVTTSASGGDPYLTWTISSVGGFSLGIDNSDSDKLKLNRNSNPSAATADTFWNTSGHLYQNNNFGLASGSVQLWSSTSSADNSADLGIARNAAGVVEINNGTPGIFRDAKIRSLLIAGTSSGIVTLTGAAAAGTWTLTLPTNDGNASQFLQTDGAGICSWASAVSRLTQFYTDAGNGTTVETDLYSYTVAAGKLASNGDSIYCQFSGQLAASATATRTIKLYFGGTAIFDSTGLTVSAGSTFDLRGTIIREDATTVRYSITLVVPALTAQASVSVSSLGSLTLSNSQILKITGQAGGVGAATNDIIAKLGWIDYEPAM